MNGYLDALFGKDRHLASILRYLIIGKVSRIEK